MSKLIEKVIYRGLSSVHSGGHAQSEAAQEASNTRGWAGRPCSSHR